MPLVIRNNSGEEPLFILGTFFLLHGVDGEQIRLVFERVYDSKFEI